MIKRVFLTGWGILLLMALNAQEKWTLQQCIDYATQNNISIKQADIQARVAALQLRQAKLTQIPSLSFSSDVGTKFGRSIDPSTNLYSTTQFLYQNMGFHGSVTVYNFGQLKNVVASSQFNAEAALANVQRASYDVLVNVATYYLQILAAKEQINISQIQATQTHTQLEDTRKRATAGLLPELNVVEIEAQLATDSSNIVAAEANFTQAILQLQGLINKDASEPFDVATPPLELFPLEPISELAPEYVYKLALANQSKQKENSLRIKGAEKNVLVNKSYLYPSISFGYNLSTNFSNSLKSFTTTPTGKYSPTIFSTDVGGVLYDVVQPGTVIESQKLPFRDWWKNYGSQINNNFGQSFGFNISIPIFNSGNTYRTQYQRSILDLKSFQLQKDQDDLTLKQNIYAAYNNAISSMKKYEIGKTTVTAAQKAYDFALKRYEVGLLNTIDLLTTQNKLLTAKSQQLNNQTDYIFKMKLLESYKGLGLKL